MGNTVRESLIRHPSTQKLKQISLYITMISSLLGLIGIVMVGIEMVKLQDSVVNAVSLVGMILLLFSVIVTYTLFCYNVFVYHQFSTGPAMVCSNILYALIGTSLMIIAKVLPVSRMFENVLSYEKDIYLKANDGLNKKSDNLSTIYPTFSGYHKDTERLVWVRLNIYGGCLFGVGLLGAISSLTIMCRLYAKQQHIRSQELARRRLSRNVWNKHTSVDKSAANEPMSRVHVYDYTAWGNRTKDLYRNKVGKKTEVETKNLNGVLKGNENKKNNNPFSSLGTASFILKNAVLCGLNGEPEQKDNLIKETSFNSVATGGIIKVNQSELKNKKEIKFIDTDDKNMDKYKPTTDYIPIHQSNFDYVDLSSSLNKEVV